MDDLALQTFLFTDIVGSTRLWEADRGAMQQALTQHNRLIEELVTAHGGSVFKLVGDAVCAVFAQAPAAVLAGVAIQAAIAAQPWPTASPLRVRMALHTGEAEHQQGDYFGPALNRVARLLAAGHGGQILLSQTTAALSRNYLPAEMPLRELGVHRLKDLSRPETISQVCAPSLADDFPPLRTLEAFEHNLPIQLTAFIGRERELAAVRAAIREARCVTLVGPGGTGKTRLALHVAADLLDDFADGVWLVELAPLSDPSVILPTIAAALGVREEPQRSLRETLATALRTKTLLLVLDNCEHVIDACADIAAYLLQRCPRLQLLATSRESLGLGGERTFSVPSMALPEAEITSAQSIADYEAVRLFVARAAAANPAFALHDRNADAVLQVCRQLDGIPLALELAAARCSVLSVEQIAARLDDRFRLLGTAARGVLPRQQTLRAMIDWSYDLLDEAERRLLARLSVFAGGWTIGAAEAICADERLPFETIFDTLAALVNKSLISADQEPEGRCRMLETIRQYAQSKLTDPGERAALRERHYAWFLAQARAGAMDIGTSDLDNLRAALEWCQELPAPAGPHQGLDLAATLFSFWNYMGYFTEGRMWTELWLEAAEIPLAIKSQAYHTAAFLAFRQDDYDRASELYTALLELQRAHGDVGGAAVALRGLGDVARGRGDYLHAVACYEESITKLRSLGQENALAQPLASYSLALYHLGRYEDALLAINEAVDRSPTDRRAIWPRRNRAMILQGLDRWQEAEAELAEISAFAQQTKLWGVYSYVLLTRAMSLWHFDDLPGARAAALQAEALFRSFGDRWGLAAALKLSGVLAHMAGASAHGAAALIQALTIFAELETVSYVAEAAIGLAACTQALLSWDQAALWLGCANAIAQKHHIGLLPRFSAIKKAIDDQGRKDHGAAWAKLVAQGQQQDWRTLLAATRTVLNLEPSVAP